MKKIAFIAGAMLSAQGQIFINGELLPSIGKKKEAYRVKLTLSQDVDNDMIQGVSGSEFEISQEELVNWYSSLPAEVEAEVKPAEVEAEVKPDNKARIKQLKKEIEKLVMAGEFGENLAKLGAELKELEDSKPTREAKIKEVKEATAEQKVQIEAYEAKIAEIEAMKAQITEIKEAISAGIESLPALREGIEEFTRKYGAKTTGDGNTAPKNLVGQELRKMYAELVAEGSKHSEAVNRTAEHFGCGTQTVNRCVLYMQHPLKPGETEYTPLVNKQFPLYWKDSKGIIHNGAPMAGVIITNEERYRKPNVETDAEGNVIATA